MSADGNTPEQAREVREVLIDILAMSPMTDAWGVGMPEIGRTADEILRALAPIRAAERQEAAREAFEEGVDAGRDDCCGIPWDQPKWIDRERPANPYRADGVTGRSGT
ncbi:MAG: hypothetical protein EOP24_32010 [Hyphomicrobiales bacterium]|nr:MAG: hypothetical protein EOP24_32010 [Hyphomicrobiales bacterium]